ncbi:CHAT domain-containing protein [Alkalinema sp. FACHB-956]|nr:CHAT domain-containing protein [Alkalinema sp. FACHB-956]
MNQSNLAIGNPNTILNAQPNTILIQNLVVGDKLWVIWTNAKGTVKTIALDVPQKELTQTVDRLRKALGSPYSNLDSLKATSHTLYNWLIPPPLQTELSQNPNLQLLFSLDHVTRYIPIATLYDGQQYLIQKHTLSNLITTDTDMGDRFAPPGQTPTILALGTSHGFPGFNPLPNVEAELHAIVRQNNDRGNRGNDRGIYPGIIQLNAAFTANSLRNPAPSRVLHIATHGSFNPKTITASFLLLGNGDKLPITDIANLTNLSTKHLVVLSACETGISSASSDGTEISGISNYFLRRGAKSVLASLWAVNDASTALLMQQFYQHLANGQTKAQALQQVQQAFITEQFSLTDARALPRANARPDVPGQPAPNSLAHPYYWAPFTLVGNSL